MCGIAGMLNCGDMAALARITEIQQHRGPDDSGLWHRHLPEGGWIGLGSRRLAILDLSPAGHMPMLSEDESLALTYNGEIYNFEEIRQQLAARGQSFRSHSDTEVILRLYEAEGATCVNRLEGMFAFALWDHSRKRLLLARDPMGIKPLYFAELRGGLLFASEVKALLRSGLILRRVRAQALRDYLTFGSMIDPRTFIEGIEALPAGSYLVWENGHVSIERYWRPKIASRHERASLSNATVAQTVKSLLSAAVRTHLVADVPVGLFLSGGMDSSALVSLLATQGVANLKTFSVIFDESDHSEALYSRAVADRWKTSHCEVKIGQQEVLASLPAALRAMDQPSIDGMNTYTISKAVRRTGIKVALTGLGGDELFAGYPTFRFVPSLERFQRWAAQSPRALRFCATRAVPLLLKPGERRNKLQAILSGGEPSSAYGVARMLFTTAQQNALLRPEVGGLSPGSVLLPQHVDLSGIDPINRVSILELSHYLLNTLLRDADCMSMAHGLELRVPFLDRRLVEYMLTVPGSLKANGGQPKPLLARATVDVLPSMVARRPKRGFVFPFEHWLRQELRAEVEAVLLQNNGPLHDFFEPAAVRQTWLDFLNGRTNWSRPWSIFVAHKWSEYHLSGEVN